MDTMEKLFNGSKMKVICENEYLIIVKIDSCLFYFVKGEDGKITLCIGDSKEANSIPIPSLREPIADFPDLNKYYLPHPSCFTVNEAKFNPAIWLEVTTPVETQLGGDKTIRAGAGLKEVSHEESIPKAEPILKSTDRLNDYVKYLENKVETYQGRLDNAKAGQDGEEIAFYSGCLWTIEDTQAILKEIFEIE